MTKVAGRHTFKGGFYNNHSFKAQNAGVSGGSRARWTSTTTPTTRSTPASAIANAALGVFTRYQQAAKFVEGSMIYNNTEFYIQDNWKVNSRLTLDYGMRFTHQQPQYDQFQQMSNFFPELWSQTPRRSSTSPGCSNGATVCSGNTRNAMDPRTGQIILPPAGAANTQVLIGTPIPDVGQSAERHPPGGRRHLQVRLHLADARLRPALRCGVRRERRSELDHPRRRRALLRPSGRQHGVLDPGQPADRDAADLRNGTLETLGHGLAPGAVPGMTTFQYDAKVPASWQWNMGIQMTLPWASSLDVSYVGNHGVNRLGGFQNGNAGQPERG